jgi:hypothetical protein
VRELQVRRRVTNDPRDHCMIIDANVANLGANEVYHTVQH